MVTLADVPATIKTDVVPAVVTIRFSHVRSFDTEVASSSQATGFFVDHETILTNRHVAGPGPFSGFVVLQNGDECPLESLFHDPVHDFGFLKLVPGRCSAHPKPLKLCPGLAKVGLSILVIGNDAGEKLSFTPGHISRVKRNAPQYGQGNYTDFNASYMQASTLAVGGSSGSPVVDQQGNVVAMMGGGRRDASTNFFLHLEPILAAWTEMKRRSKFPRGTLQTQVCLHPIDFCRALGLGIEEENNIKRSFPLAEDLLVVKRVLPHGPADQLLKEGDILLAINFNSCTDFYGFEVCLDANVGKAIPITISRWGRKLEIYANVQDLHEITPTDFVAVGEHTFHDISYQMAHSYGISMKDPGVYHTSRKQLVQSVNQLPTPNLLAFLEIVEKLPSGAQLVLRYKTLQGKETSSQSVIDYSWAGPIVHATQKGGRWTHAYVTSTSQHTVLEAAPVFYRSLGFCSEIAAVVHSFVRVRVTAVVGQEGFSSFSHKCMGLVIDSDKGCVAVSRASVPFRFCHIWLTIGECTRVAAEVSCLTPHQNVVFLRYDPTHVRGSIQSTFSSRQLRQGDTVTFVGFDYNTNVQVVERTSVLGINTVTIPCDERVPYYRTPHLDAIEVDAALATNCSSGALLDTSNRIAALWLKYGGSGKASPTGMADPFIYTHFRG